MFKKLQVLFLLLSVTASALAQEENDSTKKVISLDSVLVVSYFKFNRVKTLPAEQGTFLFAGKKTEVIQLAQLPADIANKTGRQLFAKIPGVFVYDMDGSGNQINIATRGLDPHRGWEFNIRKDGIITNSDMYGYPASHYSMPLESIERIELVRGTGSLQYGAQFGGMLNYISKQGDTSKPFSFETINSVGSYHLISSYNAVGGSKGKFSYYAYYQQKSRDGFRDNEHTNSQAQFIGFTYQLSKNFSVHVEWARSKYIYRLPGALTDSMFYANPTQATRSRNYYSPDIHIPSVNINWQMSRSTKLQLISSAVLGNRSSVMFDKPTNVKDSINLSTLFYNNRQVDIDNYHSYSTELRLLQQYKTGRQRSVLSAGVQYMNNDLHRRQLGKGTNGSDYDLTLVDPAWGRDLHFKTKNIAAFVENKFQLLKNFSVNVGVRVENGETDLSGKINYYPANEIPVTIKHQFSLLSVGFLYKPSVSTEIYGGYAQAYHPMLFKDLIPTSTYELVDPNIKDARGYNSEIGFRGNWKFLRWDMSLFTLRMNNRFGTLTQTNETAVFYTYRTNIGNSLTKGIELFVQADWLINHKSGISVFTSTAFMDARYLEGKVKSGNSNIDIHNNKVETVPNCITRNGIVYKYRKFSASFLYSYTAKTFADALNTVQPVKSTGAVGLVPAYGLLDMNLSLRITNTAEVKLSINNLANKMYFTKRPSFYPGPGIWPSEGRNASVTVVIKL